MKIFIQNNCCTVFKLIISKLKNYLLINKAEITSSPEKADIIVLGVCAAFQADEARSIKMIKQNGKNRQKIYLYGCLTSVAPGKTKIDKLRQFHSWQMAELAKTIIPHPSVAWNKVGMPTEFCSRREYRIFDPQKKFVGISMGCNFHCSYCPHKIGAGKLISFEEKEILSAVEKHLQEKVKTIVLTATDSASWGKDINSSFVNLLGKILNLPNKNTNFHVAQFHPAGLTDDYKKMIKYCQNNYVQDFQLPIQSTSSRILKLMNRDYDIAQIGEFIQAVRKKNKKINFRTDLIVGFPTETQEELSQSIDFAIKHFQEVAVYGFEFKKNTPLAHLNLPHFSKQEIEKRVRYANKKIENAGLLVHSGGQKISSLIKSDKIKAKKTH